MQENVEFAREGVHEVLPNLTKESILECLQKMSDKMDKRFDKIDNNIARIDSKVDAILEIMDKLLEEFSSIKNESRKTTEVLLRLSIKLDKMVESIGEDELDEFYALAEHIYICWEDLDTLTKKFIPLSEYLYSNLQKCKNPDYSPVIIELCRALENEFLTKIFAKFTNYIIKKYPGHNLFDFLKQNGPDYSITNKVKVFAGAIKRASKTENGKVDLTLGQMNTIVSLIKEPHLVERSQLLKEFDEYLDKETIKEKLLKKSYTDQISKIINDYRNPSAHPGYMTLDKARECKEFMPERMDYLMECVRIIN